MSSKLQEEIDRSFGEGPLQRPVQDRIAAGRRALRRRRAAEAVAALAVAGVLGAGWYAVAPGQQVGSGQIAVTPTPSPTPTSSPAPAWEDNTPVRYVDGELQIRPGVVVHEHIENPYGYDAPQQSDALDLTFEGHRTWLLAESTKNGFGYSSSVPSNGWASFADWVADQVEGATGGDDGWPDTLRLTDRGTVVASEGSEILQRTDDPRLGDSFAAPGTPTGAAVVRVGATGRDYFVVWRVVDGELDVITTPPRDVVGATFDELLSSARGKYASGEGLR